MKEIIMDLLLAVVTAAVPVLTAYLVRYIKSAKDNIIAGTDDARQAWYIQEIADAISAAVSATNQTYVDALKEAGKFDKDAQIEAAKRALAACLASISPAAKELIEKLYGDIHEYLSTRIEAEVRNQKLAAGSAEPADQ